MAYLRQDRGQAFPIYVVMVAGLLFLAFAFFAVGQASATRNGAQGAADSAALAAAQRAREELVPRVLAALMTPGGLDTLFDDGVVLGDARAEATNFAAKNHADLLALDGRLGGAGRFTFKASVTTQYTVGNSVIPGTEQDHGTATATALIELRCALPPGGGAGASPTPAPTRTPVPTPTSTPPSPVTITCDGKDLPTDPMPAPEELFTVKLVD
ncbi:pilus assembly protein TadG-related protein [Streptomyces sp. NBC_00083]|uniref:pilus assembly protein TadG-related protein n=1 Tax=Streptomyces sp. NBC_00083 TaxID=2975647 RepID=UPI00224E4942|nr:pilus assembly protein TadG-related protein [Streptomyces sp. NBC_00083]MCX5385322.1 pilus assembly protein TadG-related protein [Streptomyces sp. NBC_00083]